MGCRRLLALITGLPADAATWRDETRWNQQLELAAQQVEATDAVGRAIVGTLVKLHTGKDAKFPQPLRIEHPARPQPQKPPRKPATPATLAAMFGRS